jgi:hypothetical protein
VKISSQLGKLWTSGARPAKSKAAKFEQPVQLQTRSCTMHTYRRVNYQGRCQILAFLQAKVAVPEIAHRSESCQVPFKLDGRLTPIHSLSNKHCLYTQLSIYSNAYVGNP